MKKDEKFPAMEITFEGKEMPFKDYVAEIGGSGKLYERDIRETFNCWRTADFAYVDDYIAPIAAQVIIDAHEINQELYGRIMTLIDEAYRTLKPEIDPNHPELTRIK